MKKMKLIPMMLVLVLLFSGCAQSESGRFSSVPVDSRPAGVANDVEQNKFGQDEASDIPEFSGEPYCVLNNNVPDFETPVSAEPFEDYNFPAGKPTP